MTFDQVMQKHSGYWEGNTAFIRDAGYTWRIAEKTDAGVEILFDGKRYVGEPAEEVAPEIKPAMRKGKKRDAVDDVSPEPSE